MSHSGLSWPASMAGLTSEGRGLAKGACCLREKFFFWSLPSRRTFSILAFSKRERGGMTVSPWPFFFFLAAAGRTHSSKNRKTQQTCKDASACTVSILQKSFTTLSFKMHMSKNKYCQYSRCICKYVIAASAGLTYC